jgi:hypothetical protein
MISKFKKKLQPHTTLPYLRRTLNLTLFRWFLLIAYKFDQQKLVKLYFFPKFSFARYAFFISSLAIIDLNLS